MNRVSGFVYHITRPYFGYLGIVQSNKKDYDFYAPLFLVVVLSVLSFVFDFDIKKMLSFAEKTNVFFAILPGFYIAALSAIATFNKPSIDKLIPDNPTPYVYQRTQGRDIKTELTRRRFLSMMFSFLASESLLLFLLSLVSSLMIDINLFSIIFLIVFCFLFFQMIIVTLWGLYYLSEKMHHNDA